VPFAHPGNWPDADMLPLGYLDPEPGEGKARDIRLTHDDQQTMLTLWSIARSPLVLGANLTKLDDWTANLLTNREVLDVDQFGHDQRQVTREGNTAVRISKGKPGTTYLAFFNLGDTPSDLKRTYAFYGLTGPSYKVRELWSGTEIGTLDSIHLSIPVHGCKLLKLTRP
jgi:alpha-galactosidase